MPNSKNNKTKKPVAKSKKSDDTPVRIRKDMPNPHGEGKPDEQEEWNARQHGHKNDPMHTDSYHKKGKKGKSKKHGGKNYPVLDSNHIKITKFIKCMNEKNYAKANKYLQAVLEDKMKARIASGI